MLLMAGFVERLDALIQEAIEEHGISKNAVISSFGFDPSQYRRYIRDGLAFSEKMLVGISESKYLDISYNELKALKAVDELPLKAQEKVAIDYINNLTVEQRKKWLKELQGG